MITCDAKYALEDRNDGRRNPPIEDTEIVLN